MWSTSYLSLQYPLMAIFPHPYAHTGFLKSPTANKQKPFSPQSLCICWFLCLEKRFLSVNLPLLWQHPHLTHTHPLLFWWLAPYHSLVFSLKIKCLYLKDFPWPPHLMKSLQSLYDTNLFLPPLHNLPSLKLSLKSTYLYIICLLSLEC